MIQKNDWILAGGIFLAAVLLFAGMLLLRRPGSEIEISIDGERLGVYSLDEEQIIDAGEGNRVEIANGQARMLWADCPDQFCARQMAISRVGETIVCLPNRVTVRVLQGETPEYDAVAR